MKKNKMMRAASALLVAVLLTTCAVSGTFAKYTTADDGTDTARVAKWGVTVTATGDNVFDNSYDDATNGATAGTKVVSSVTTEDVLAPGTNGTLGGIAITGTPEVMVDVDVTATLTLAGWTIDHDNDPATPNEEYCPIVFTIDGETYGTGDGVVTPTHTSANIDALQTAIKNAIESKFSSLTADNVGANEALDSSVSVSWAWDFNTAGTGDYDKYDTALGDLAAAGTAPTIAFECEATVTQVD